MPKTNNNLLAQTHRFSHRAMATIFEVLIFHPVQSYAQQAAREVFAELDRLELELSRFIENSDIARINNLARNETIRIGPDAFECLRQCVILCAATGGIFDITVGSLINCRFDKNRQLINRTPDELEKIRECTGMHHLLLNSDDFTVTTKISDIEIDLGGFGKGYAVDKMAELLLDWDFHHFLIHGGKSSVYARGTLPEMRGWPVSLSNPFRSHKKFDTILLKDQAMSASGLQKGQHIIDPRTGYPITSSRATWAFAPTAALCDALSTAFMLMTPAAINQYCVEHPGVQGIILAKNPKEPIFRFGFK